MYVPERSPSWKPCRLLSWQKKKTGIRWPVLLAVLILVPCTTPFAHSQEVSQQKRQTVVLIIDFGDDFQKRFTRIRWTKDMTVLNALQAASKHPRGIRFEYRGKGKTAFLNSIDKLKNEGRDRNWIFRVNGKLGDRSFAIFSVQPMDTILWKFGKYQ